MNSDTEALADLEISGLSVTYNGHCAVSDLRFSVRAGEVYGLLGPSGAGKSSVLAALTGVIPAQGSIHHRQLEISRLPARERRFGHVYQEFRLFDWMTVHDNVAFPCRALGWRADDIATVVRTTLGRVGLTANAARKVRDLSGGQRQRVAFGRAIVFRPRVLLLDEPFSHLDPPLRDELKLVLQQFLNETRTPSVLVTHDHDEAFTLCDRVGVMIDGKLVQEGSPLDLLACPIDLPVARLLGFANTFDGLIRRVGDNFVGFEPEGMNAQWRARGAGSRFEAGQRVHAVCRPERILILAATKGGHNHLPATVLSLHALPDSTTITLEGPVGRPLIVNTSGHVSVRPGDKMMLAIPPDDLMVYPMSAS